MRTNKDDSQIPVVEPSVLCVRNAEIRYSSESIQARPSVEEIQDIFRCCAEEFVRATGLKVSQRSLEVYAYISGAMPDEISLDLAVKKGRRVVVLPSTEAVGVIIEGRWFAIERSTYDQVLKFRESMIEDGENGITLGQYLEAKSIPSMQSRIIDDVTTDKSMTQRSTSSNFKALGLARDLYAYQQEGADFMVSLANRGVGTLLGDQMGLGKTAQAIALALSQRDRGKILVVCPASLAINWSREIADFAPSLSVCLHSGPNRTGVITAFETYDLVITSYETLVNDIGFFEDYEWQLVVLDEAQNIRNPDTLKSAVVKRLSRRVSVAITGTPIENKLLDAWSILEFVLPTLLGRQDEFKLEFPDEVESARALGSILSPVLLRRLVSEVASDLPSLIEHPVALELDHYLRSVYNDVCETAPSAFAATTRLRVICAHSDERTFATNYAKVDRATSLIREIVMNEQKVLVFASFQIVIDKLYEFYIKEFPIACVGVVDGRVGPADRQSIIDTFQNFDGPGILLMNPQAAGVGLNITAANHVIHFNPEWNPALTAQATARSYRRKQSLPVSVHHLYYVDTVEEDAVNKAEWKQILAAGFDDGSNQN